MNRPGKASPTVRIADAVLSGSRPQMLAMPVPTEIVDDAASNVAARVNASFPPGASPNQKALYPNDSSSRIISRSSAAVRPYPPCHTPTRPNAIARSYTKYLHQANGQGRLAAPDAG